MHPDAATISAWYAFGRAVSSLRDSLQRGIRLSAWPRDRCPPCLAGRSMDLQARGVSGYRSQRECYAPSEVTGLDFVVQASLTTDKVAVDALREAFHHIQDYAVTDFAFLCHGGTHRSVACCCLLAALVYPDAGLVFNARRPSEAAALRGLIPSLPDVDDLSDADAADA